MSFQIIGAVDEGDDSMLGMGADIVHRSQQGKIDAAIPESGDKFIVVVRDYQLHFSSHLLGEIRLQRLSLWGGKTIGRERENNWLLCGRQRHKSKNAQQGQSCGSITQSHSKKPLFVFNFGIQWP